MARLPLSVALLCCALPLACGPTPEREDGPFAGTGTGSDDSDDGGDLDGADDDEAASSDDDGGEDDDGDTGGGDGEPAEDDGDDSDDDPPAPPAYGAPIPQPRMHCPAGQCMEGGLGTFKELEGRDAVREAFFGVAGFPDGHTYSTHTHGSSYAPPHHGVVGQAAAAIRVMTTLLHEGGMGACEDLPLTGEAELASAPGVVLQFAPGVTAPPQGYLGAGVAYAKRVHMTDASGATATLEMNCGRNQAFASLRLAEGPDAFGRIDLHWDTEDDASHRIDLAAYSKARDERVAFRFATDAEEYGLWLVRARAGDAPGRHAGLRMFVHGDALDQHATVFLQQLDEQPFLHRADGADSSNLASVDGAAIMCADFASDDPLKGYGGPCPGLEIWSTTAPEADADGTFSIAWVASPAGDGGLLDAMQGP